MDTSRTRRFLFMAGGALLLCVAALALALRMTEQLFDPGRSVILTYFLRNILLAASIFLLWFGVSVLIKVRMKDLFKNLLTLVAAVMTVAVLLEVGFSVVRISSGGGDVLFSKNWMNFYWEENTLGYRDADPTEIDRPDRENILIVGDSYVAGHGLKREEERFSNMLREELKSCYDVFNLGVCGADTKDELGFLKTFPVRPDLVILVHGKNDIQKVRPYTELMELLNIDPDILEKLPKQSGQHSFIVQNSFLLNSVEYLIYKMQEKDFFNGLVEKYETLDEFLRSADGQVSYLSYYKHDRLFAAHLAHVDSVVGWTDAQNAQFLLVLFPATEDQLLMETDLLINQPIVRHVAKKGVPTLNLTPVLLRSTEAERQVNWLDPHPSHSLNRAVADTLAKVVIEKMRGIYECDRIP